MLRQLFSNYFLVMGFFSWGVAQLIKVLLALVSTKKFVPERLIGSGGMPSSHSSLVCGLATSVFLKCGYQSVEFALALSMAAIVMYDAMGVRRAAGEQAKTLNQLVKHHEANGGENLEIPEKSLKELLGHTPLEVLSGAVLGVVLVCLLSQIPALSAL